MQKLPRKSSKNQDNERKRPTGSRRQRAHKTGTPDTQRHAAVRAVARTGTCLIIVPPALSVGDSAWSFRFEQFCPAKPTSPSDHRNHRPVPTVPSIFRHDGPPPPTRGPGEIAWAAGPQAQAEPPGAARSGRAGGRGEWWGWRRRRVRTREGSGPARQRPPGGAAAYCQWAASSRRLAPEENLITEGRRTEGGGGRILRRPRGIIVLSLSPHSSRALPIQRRNSNARALGLGASRVSPRPPGRGRSRFQLPSECPNSRSRFL